MRCYLHFLGMGSAVTGSTQNRKHQRRKKTTQLEHVTYIQRSSDEREQESSGKYTNVTMVSTTLPYTKHVFY